MAKDTQRPAKKKPAKKKPAKKPQAPKKPFLGGLFAKKKTSTPGEEVPETVAGNGTVIQSKAAVLGKGAAWVAMIFMLAMSVVFAFSLFSPTVEAQETVEAEEDPTGQQAADYARGYVGAWLRATAEETDELSRYITVGNQDVTATEATDFRGLNIASVETDDNGVSTVIVSAEVLTLEPEEDDATDEEEAAEEEEEEPQSVWLPAWYQVNIHHTDGDFTPLGWPAPVPTPETGPVPQLGYSYAASEDVESTVDAFFQAYAVEEGDVTRLTHPESTIQSLGNAQYTSVGIEEITTDEDYRDEVPEDGTTAQALVRVALGTGEDTSRATTYALTLETRGGRWEVRAIDAAPVLSLTEQDEESDDQVTGPPQSPESDSGEESTTE